MSKYHATPTTIDNICFASKKEARRYGELKLLQKAGEIEELTLQPEFILQPSYKKDGKTVRAIKYRADFQYYDCREKRWVVEDVKGCKTKVYRIKKKMLEYVRPDLYFIET